ncbi:MAG: NACHT domain-containing protein [Cyanobacteria bacterium P01_D01_bin.156]
MTGSEALFLAALSGLTSIITDVIKDTGTGIVKKIDISLNVSRKRIIERYVRHYLQYYGGLKVSCLGINEPIDLEKVYVSPKVFGRSIKDYQSREDVENDFLATLNYGSGKSSVATSNAIDVANENQFLMILGGPGSGKSVFLRKLGLEALKGGKGPYKQKCWPVLIELRSFDGESGSLEKMIAKEFVGHLELDDAYNLVRGLLEKGKLLILLDGIDEIPLNGKRFVLSEIERFIKDYGNNRFVASCREAAYTFRTEFRLFKDVVMASFEDDQIRDYINRWFEYSKSGHTEEERAEMARECRRLIGVRGQEHVQQLARTPLLLTLLCSVYEKNLNFPKNKSLLISRALSVVMQDWVKGRSVEYSQEHKFLDPDLQEDLLSDIAYSQFEEGNIVFYRNNILEVFLEGIEGNRNASKSLNGESVLQITEVQQGILVKLYPKIYSFSHFTLQEYFVARYIVDNEELNELISSYLFVERWREVFVLASGLIRGRKNPEFFLFSIKDELNKYYEQHELEGVVHFSNSLVSSDHSDYLYAGKLAAFVYIIRTFLALARFEIEFDALKDPLCLRALHLSSSLGLFPNPDDFVAFGFILDALFHFAILKSDLPSMKGVRLRGTSYRVNATCENAFKRMEYLEEIGIFNPRSILNIKKIMQHYGDENFPVPPDENSKKKLIYEILSLYLKALGINKSVLKIVAIKNDSLGAFFYGTDLLVCCMKASARISPDVWDELSTQLI